MSTYTHKSLHLLLLLYPHQAHTHTQTTPTLLRPYYAGQKCPFKNVSQSPKKRLHRKKKSCVPPHLRAERAREGRGRREEEGGRLMCKLVSVLYGSPIIYSAARRSSRATRICLILNYTLVYITWQSVHINLIGF